MEFSVNRFEAPHGETDGSECEPGQGARVGVPASRPAAGPETPVSEVRKTVTVLFADLVESTRLGRQLDPEALRHLMSQYFEAMQSVVERHGGVVEKFIGDAVMAVFGIPVLHEDDALRAVRAAAEMRESLATLNQDLERTWGVRLEGRIGINSGEVIAGDHLQGHGFVTGDVVNVAKRLEEAAATGETLIGEATHRLVRDAVVAERVSDRVVKGGETVEALKLVEVLPRAPGHTRRFDSPLVDREQELSSLRSVFASVLQNRACHLLTVLGSAGIGKSRLVQEFVADVGADATVLRGHCLPYGEGITYWPLAEVVREIVRTEGSADAEPSSAAIAELLPDEEKADLIGELISEALGLGGTGAGRGEETSWAVRKLFEALARRRPLVVVFDDLQWAEPTFIELVDYLAELSRDAPILLALYGAARALRQPSRLGRRQAQRRVDAAGAAGRRRLSEADREPARPRAAPGRRRDADRRGGRRQRAVRRGAAGDARRRRVARVGRRSLGAGG